MRLIDGDALMAKLNRKKAGPANKKYIDGFNDCLMRVRSMVHSEPTLTPQNEWVSVEERLPQSIINKVLVYCENGYIGYGHYEKYQGEETWYNLESGEPFASWNLENCSPYKVTHWMPLPKPPEVEEDT